MLSVQTTCSDMMCLPLKRRYGFLKGQDRDTLLLAHLKEMRLRDMMMMTRDIFRPVLSTPDVA